MRVCYIGVVKFSYEVLKYLVTLKVDICGVVVNSENNFNSDYCDLRPFCTKNTIDFHDTQNINSSETIDWLRQKAPDIIFCFGWSQLIKKELLALPRLGVLGFHPALLPQNRGRHPIIWALALGLNKTGSTFFFMDEGADSGDILSQKEVAIFESDNSQVLYNRITETALNQVAEFIPELESGDYKTIPQDDERANSWRKRGRQDGQIDFRMSTKGIRDLVRALTKPYIGAHIAYKGKNIKVWEVRETRADSQNLEPGKVLDVVRDGFIVKTGDGALLVHTHDFKDIPQRGEYL